MIESEVPCIHEPKEVFGPDTRGAVALNPATRYTSCLPPRFESSKKIERAIGWEKWITAQLNTTTPRATEETANPFPRRTHRGGTFVVGPRRGGMDVEPRSGF